MIEAVTKYFSLLFELNKEVNLVSRKLSKEAYSRKVFPEIELLCSLIEAESFVNTVLDIGSGGGVPVIPLAVRFPRISFKAVDSNGKKADALTFFSESLQLVNLEVLRLRAEELPRELLCDVGVAKAVAEIRTLLEYFSPFIREGGLLLFPKGKAYRTEVAAAKRAALITGFTFVKADMIGRKEEDLGYIVSYRKTHKAQVSLPRAVGEAKKDPFK